MFRRGTFTLIHTASPVDLQCPTIVGNQCPSMTESFAVISFFKNAYTTNLIKIASYAKTLLVMQSYSFTIFIKVFFATALRAIYANSTED